MSTTAKAAEPTARRRKSGERKSVGSQQRSRTETWWGWAFIIPTMCGVLLFYIWPLIKTAYYSFTKWGAFGRNVNWVGIENYRELTQDPYMLSALGNTILYTLIVLCGIPLALIIASLINRPGLKFASLYRVAFFMPYVAMPVAVALVWRTMFAGDFGIINYVLGLFGITGKSWLTEPNTAIFAVGIVGIWASFGFNMIILSAGLKAISPDLYEAASLDGASNWTQFRKITVPMLSPSIFFVTVMTVINGLQLFDLLYTMMRGNSNPAMADSQSLVYMFYNAAFINNDKGYGAAIAMVILVIVGAVTAFQFWMQKKWVNYD